MMGRGLSSRIMKEIWGKCGSPRENPECWSREMKKAWKRKKRRGR